MADSIGEAIQVYTTDGKPILLFEDEVNPRRLLIFGTGEVLLGLAEAIEFAVTHGICDRIDWEPDGTQLQLHVIRLDAE